MPLAPSKRFQIATPQTPALITSGQKPTAVFPNDVGIGKPVFWLLIAVRDMVDDTYVRIGDSVNQVSSMYYSNDFMLYDVPDGFVFDASSFFCISDNGSAVLEVIWMGPEVYP